MPVATDHFVELQTALGTRVRELRGLRHMTQEQLAASTGIGARHIQKIEAGEVNVTLHTIARLADALAVPTHELLKQESGA